MASKDEAEVLRLLRVYSVYNPFLFADVLSSSGEIKHECWLGLQIPRQGLRRKATVQKKGSFTSKERQ